MDIDPNLLIGDYARELSELLDQAGDEEDDAFERGRRFGLAQAASLLVQEARAFGADTNKLGLGVLSDRADLL